MNSGAGEGSVLMEWFELLLPPVATALAVGMTLSMGADVRLFVKEGTTGPRSPLPYLFTWGNATMNVFYGLLLSQPALLLCNLVNSLVSATFLHKFYQYSPHRNALLRMVLLSAACMASLMVYTTRIEPLEAAQNFFGAVGSLATILLFTSPISNVLYVCRTGDARTLSLPYIFGAAACSTAWFLYGNILRNIYIWGPNAVGMAVSAIQFATFAQFGGKRDGVLSDVV